jgi:hypothetical protein
MRIALRNCICSKIDLLTIQKPAATKATVDAGEDAPSIDASILEGRPPARARREGPELARCKMGCYVCSRTSSSRFHRWRETSLTSVLEKIEALRPESEKICDRCFRAAHRNASEHEVHLSICALSRMMRACVSAPNSKGGVQLTK